MKYFGGVLIIVKLCLSFIVLSILCMPTLGQTTAKDWNDKGNALGSQGKYDEAITAFNKAIELNPKYAEAWYNKGFALELVGKTSESNAAYAKAKELGHKGLSEFTEVARKKRWWQFW
ncbi:MAG: tetratricopeptide repeat protein [Methanotrichaceae archaeon]|nr:tetratricopeptide repeat protein [Methanotrichaceae archaeon]